MGDVVVIGGGVIGLSSAYYLNKAGFSVTVIERGNISEGCSFGNMGYISPSHFVPLASPGIISQGLKWMVSASSPFYIKPRLSLSLIEWGIKFWKNSNAATVEKNIPHMHNLLQLSRNAINDLHTTIGGDIDMQTIGCLMMCKEQKTLDHEFHLADEAEMLGLKVDRLLKDEVQQLEPDVEINAAGAVLFKDDCHFNPGKMMIALKNYLTSKGVQFKLNTTVTEFEKSNNRVTAIITDKEKINCDQLVLAAGSWLPLLAKKMDIKLLLQPGKGYSYTYPQVEKNIKYPAILVDGRCAVTPWGSSLRIGGTMELSGINNKVMVKRMEGIYKSATDFYPGLKIDFPPVDKIWSGLRPVTPDGLPYIGKHSMYENVVFAGGHAMLGITLGTGTGKIVSDLVQRKTTPIDISAFRVERFT
jgi:D-amino-acid dehydrogenase